MDVELFPKNLDQHTLWTAAIELAVENLFPGPEVEAAGGDGHDALPPHDRALEMRVGVVLVSVVIVLRVRLLGREFFEPALEVAMQARLVVIDEHARRDV